MIALLILQALDFAAWAVTAFQTLLDWRRRAVAGAGAPFPGLPATLRAVRAWWSDPAARPLRRRFLGLTAAMILLQMLVLAAWRPS